MDLYKNRAREDQEITEISDLPDDAIDSILGHLLLGDAVRTSILSRKWRDRWKRVENLVFDYSFISDEIIRGNLYNWYCSDDTRDAEKYCSDYIDAIGTVLRLHNGPIRKFVLDIPEFSDDPAIHEQVDEWITYASGNGVRDITLDFYNKKIGYEPRPLPSSIFRCRELERLSLKNCMGDLPDYFTGFGNLVDLHLTKFDISGDGLDALITSCPLLENLYIRMYDGPLSVNAPRLKTLEATSCKFEALAMAKVPNLVTLSITCSRVYLLQPLKLETLFDLMPSIESVTLDLEIFYVLEPHHIPKMLPTQLGRWKNLTLTSLMLKDQKEALCVLCLLRSSPYLQTLTVNFSVMYSSYVQRAAIALLEEECSKPCHLNSLTTVKVQWSRINWALNAFVKFILASCPALEMLYLKGDCRISKGVLECYRALTKAKIICTEQCIVKSHEASGQFHIMISEEEYT